MFVFAKNIYMLLLFRGQKKKRKLDQNKSTPDGYERR
jgi:hypothetical protein